MKTKVNAITLSLSDKSITLTTHMIAEQELYKAQDLLIGSGMTSKESSKTLENWKNSPDTRSLDFRDRSIKGGKTQGTYLTENEIYMLAMYVDTSFMLDVVAAFKALAHGDIGTALNVSMNRVKIHKVMLQPRPTLTLKSMFIESGMKIDEFVNHILKNSMWNNKADVDNRKRLANSLLKLVEGINVSGKNVADHAIRVLNAEKEIHKYRAKKFSQAANMKKTLAIKANRKLSRKAEALEILIEETELELEDVRNRAKKIGSIAITDRKQKNELEGKIIELEEKL
ncbi:hypothetical protein, partial [Aeromonas piscicola]|uniref:hypothetical protein n=1 Tax=Aeromonas piscicola TaxID=600645 RepID=UPI0005B495DB